ncbi:hypothetical protein HOD38_04140 [archaeon]|jgi:hypothetical protein|nr:hypothetical protein [archaeon]MBT4397431.1 hypothetical protein [archaeon]MBT4440503.1 hypothetical protein [archaeon]
MKKEVNVFWDALPLVLVLVVALGSLVFVDFDGGVDGYVFIPVEDDDFDDDGLQNDYDACNDDNAPDNLVSYFAFEEGYDFTWGNTYDSYASAYQNFAYLGGDTLRSSSAGKVGDGVLFNSGYDDDGYGYVTDDVTLDFTDEFTIMFWMKKSTSGTGYEALVSKSQLIGFSFTAYGVSVNEGDTITFTTGPNQLEGSIDVVDNQWHHVAVVKTDSFRNQKKLIYVDGVLDSSVSYSSSVSVNEVDLNFGRSPSGSLYYHGYLDEVALFNDALTASEVEDLYDLGTEGLSYCSTGCSDSDGDGYENDLCGGDDCDESNSSINPGASEVCSDLVDNDCDTLIDYDDSDCTCMDSDIDGYISDDCGGDDCHDYDPNIHPAATEVCNDGVDNDCDGLIDCADDFCFGSLNLENITCCFNGTVGGSTDNCLSGEICYNSTCAIGTPCTDTANCTASETCVDGYCQIVTTASSTTTCLVDETYWLNGDGNATLTNATYTDSAYMVVVEDGTCLGDTAVTFDLYHYDQLNSSLGTFTAVNGTDDAGTSYLQYTIFNLSDYITEDDYYVFVANDGLGNVTSYSLTVCADVNNCTFEVDGNVDTTPPVMNTSLFNQTEEVDCASEWDCSAVDWSECDPLTAIKTRDLDLCIQPTDIDCLNDLTTYPESSASCIASIDDEERDTEDVPVFTWFNLFMVVFVLIGYYWYRR